MIVNHAGDECDCVWKIVVGDAFGLNQELTRFREAPTEEPLSLYYIIGERGAW